MGDQITALDQHSVTRSLTPGDAVHTYTHMNLHVSARCKKGTKEKPYKGY